ncbi:MAG: AraC family transcriptional regulator [Prevotellaceae bacterium]|nr:AraC family transcriptional regulator [Prevotellaceae bacterium]
MMMEIPIPSFSKTKELKESRFVMNNHYAKASFAEIKTVDFSIVDIHFRSFEDFKVYSQAEENDSIWFCAALQGNVICLCEPERDEFVWRNGYANLQSYNGVGGYINFRKKEPFRMVEIMLSRDYLTKIAAAAPSLFDEILSGSNTSNPLFKAFPENIPFCPAIGEALINMLNYKWTGNSASLYLDAKIREILSLFLCRKENDCKRCNSYSPRNNDKLIRAKEIVEQCYQNPPSLHELSLMIGTNECMLKNGFKTLFGTTVFGYLFDYRMKLAGQYLSDTDKTIQEIADLVGYEHQSHFSTAFKRKFCVSPQQYRANVFSNNCSQTQGKSIQRYIR